MDVRPPTPSKPDDVHHRLAPRRPNMAPVRSSGKAQLSLVEHALCPVDPRQSLREHLVHETTYGYADRNRHLKLATVRVICPSGLSPADEFVLWGLLALTFGQSEPSIEFHATPHFCLRRLGFIDRNCLKGGSQYVQFRDTVKRLARVIYENTAFYDAVRGEHREVAFGFLKYSLPIDPQSSRAWRFIWDQQFFELCQATGGSLWFDLDTYRRLDFASRRLFVLLQKIFHRSVLSPAFDVRRLSVDVLGFAPTIDMPHLKAKVAYCVERLAAEGIVARPADQQAQAPFQKHGVGKYSITLMRGPYFDQKRSTARSFTADESPLVDPLRAIGFDDAGIARVLRTYRAALIREWADITLAAKEHNGDEFFRKSPAAYFMDNIRNAADGKRTPPDWWHDMRREEKRRQREADREQFQKVAETDEEVAFKDYIEGEARAAFENVMERLVSDLVSKGKSPEDAHESGAYMARIHFLNRFRQAHPELAWRGTTEPSDKD